MIKPNEYEIIVERKGPDRGKQIFFHCTVCHSTYKASANARSQHKKTKKHVEAMKSGQNDSWKYCNYCLEYRGEK